MKAIIVLALVLFWYNYNSTDKDIPVKHHELKEISDTLYLPGLDSKPWTPCAYGEDRVVQRIAESHSDPAAKGHRYS